MHKKKSAKKMRAQKKKNPLRKIVHKKIRQKK